MNATNLHQRICYCPPVSPSNAATADAAFSSVGAASRGQLGTVLYRGPVPPTRGEWYGIEWDDPSRGRHSGTHDKTGVQYFKTRIEGAGSFFRTDAKGLDIVGKSFPDAVAERYLDDGTIGGPHLSVQSADAATSTSSPLGAAPNCVSRVERHETSSNFDIEVVLNDRVTSRFKDLGRLREIGLEWEGVSRATREAKAGDAKEAQRELREFGGQLKSLEGLDLSFSLLPTLEEVDEIIAVLPRLSRLVINSNRFRRLEKPLTLPGFERLVQLEVNNTLMTWPELRRVALSLPNLVDLQFGFNRLRRLVSEHAGEESTPVEQVQELLPKLERLNLESNELESWEDLTEELARLPRLTELVLDNNRLRDLAYPAKGLGQQGAPALCICNGSSAPRSLRHLRRLSLRRNLLSSWKTSIEALAASSASAFPSLVDFRVANNPVFGATSPPSARGDNSRAANATLPAADDPTTLRREADNRLLIIALLPQLSELEGSPVHASERVDAERFWLGRLAQGQEKLEDLSDWARERVSALEKEYPDLAIRRSGPRSAADDPPGPRTIKSRLIRLTIKAPPEDFPKLSSAAPVELSVLPSLRTLILRTQIARSLGSPVPKTKYRLIARLQPAEGGSEEIEVEIPPNEEGKEVSWWGLQDGDTVAVVAV